MQMGGGYFTQSAPTNFHTFYKRKMLTKGEKIEDFKEVTEAEKTALEASDAKWERPPQSFIDGWNNAAGTLGKYNEATGYFELNGIVDIPYEEAINTYEATADLVYRNEINLSGAFAMQHEYKPFRTNFPIKNKANQGRSFTGSNMFKSNYSIEVISFQGTAQIDSPYSCFRDCPRLRKILGIIQYFVDNQSFYNSPNLESVALSSIRGNVKFKDCPKLNYNTFDYIIKNISSSYSCVCTVHADVYAKLTGDTSNAAAAALSEADLAKWMALVEAGSSKNVTFAKA